VECPVQLEATFTQVHNFWETSSLASIEVSITRVHIDEQLLMKGENNFIDPEQWNPLIMNFCEFFGLSGKLHPSRLAPLFGPITSKV
jgi:flavin reductase (DIM6/NTAB) family NADH-FMN oxidoreductase RutF